MATIRSLLGMLISNTFRFSTGIQLIPLRAVKFALVGSMFPIITWAVRKIPLLNELNNSPATLTRIMDLVKAYSPMAFDEMFHTWPTPDIEFLWFFLSLDWLVWFIGQYLIPVSATVLTLKISLKAFNIVAQSTPS